MQKLSLEQVLELSKGVPYNIDLRPGQVCVVLDGSFPDDMSSAALLDRLLNPPEVPALPPSSEDDSGFDWNYFEKHAEKERKLEKKEKKRSKKVSQKKVWKNYKCALENLGVKD